MNTSDVPESLNVRLELVDTKMAMDRLIRAIDLMRDDSGKPCGLFDSHGAESYAHILINHIAALESQLEEKERSRKSFEDMWLRATKEVSELEDELAEMRKPVLFGWKVRHGVLWQQAEDGHWIEHASSKSARDIVEQAEQALIAERTKSTKENQ